jgi:hypothetical protein
VPPLGARRLGQHQQITNVTLKLIGQGSAADYMVHTVMKQTANANGDVTVSFDRRSAQCG